MRIITLIFEYVHKVPGKVSLWGGGLFIVVVGIIRINLVTAEYLNPYMRHLEIPQGKRASEEMKSSQKPKGNLLLISDEYSVIPLLCFSTIVNRHVSTNDFDSCWSMLSQIRQQFLIRQQFDR